ncbi:hypothetical protein U0070_018346, partial [Myodes glareolus]
MEVKESCVSSARLRKPVAKQQASEGAPKHVAEKRRQEMAEWIELNKMEDLGQRERPAPKLPGKLGFPRLPDPDGLQLIGNQAAGDHFCQLLQEAQRREGPLGGFQYDVDWELAFPTDKIA